MPIAWFGEDRRGPELLSIVVEIPSPCRDALGSSLAFRFVVDWVELEDAVREPRTGEEQRLQRAPPVEWRQFCPSRSSSVKTRETALSRFFTRFATLVRSRTPANTDSIT